MSDGIKPQNILFVCSRNQWRSPTAEKIWKNVPGINTRSAGTSPNARRTVSAQDVKWADQIFVMEGKHRSRLRAQFSQSLEHKPIHVLDIPDEYQFMDTELVNILKTTVSAILGLE